MKLKRMQAKKEAKAAAKKKSKKKNLKKETTTGKAVQNMPTLAVVNEAGSSSNAEQKQIAAAGKKQKSRSPQQ